MCQHLLAYSAVVSRFTLIFKLLHVEKSVKALRTGSLIKLHRHPVYHAIPQYCVVFESCSTRSEAAPSLGIDPKLQFLESLTSPSRGG